MTSNAVLQYMEVSSMSRVTEDSVPVPVNEKVKGWSRIQ